jgi:hypothetical protein
LIFAAQPSNIVAGATFSPAPSVSVVDSSGAIVATSTAAVTVSLSSGANLIGSTTVNAVQGVAVFPNLTVMSAGTGYTLTSSSTGMTGSVSVAFNVSVPVIPTITLSLPTASVLVGGTLAGAVTLSQPAPDGGLNVVLASANPSSVAVSSGIISVAAGQTTASFLCTGVSLGNSALTASAAGFLSASVQVSVVAPEIPASFFGLTVLNYTNLTPSFQFATTRSWDAYPNLQWALINTAPGMYNFADLDNFLALNASRDVVYTLGGDTPGWAGPYSCSPPTNLRDWDAWVTAVATHAGTKIKYWELWNEPDNKIGYCSDAGPGNEGDIALMITMAQHANTIIKAINPAAIILSPACDGGDYGFGPPWLTTFLAGGGARAVDIIAFHGYGNGTAEDIVQTEVPAFKAAMALNGAGGLPMWDTEAAWYGGPYTVTPPTLEQEAGYLAKSYLLHWSIGVARYIWYAYDGAAIWGQLYASGHPTAAATAYQQVESWMVGAAMPTPCVENALTHVWTCTLTRSGGYSAEAVWITSSTAQVSVPAQYVEYRDLAGVVHQVVNGSVTAGDQPILLETGPLP